MSRRSEMADGGRSAGRYSPSRADLRDPRSELEGRDPLLVRAARFSRWDGTQAVPDLDAGEVLDALADDVMNEGDIGEALRRLLERGWRASDPTQGDVPGLRELIERLRRQREQVQERYRLGDVLGDIRRELEAIVGQEREGIGRRMRGERPAQAAGDQAGAPDVDQAGAPDRDQAGAPDAGEPRALDGEGGQPDRGEAVEGSGAASGSAAGDAPDEGLRRLARDVAARHLERLDGLPPDVGGRIRGLRDYDFLEPEARRRFDELMERLEQTVGDQFMAGLSDAIKNLSPEDLAANREMVRDLNQLLEERLAGREPDVDEFLAKHGRFFPGARTLDDIIEQLSERMAAMQSLLRSLSPEQRAELQGMLDAVLRDDRLRWDLARLAGTLDQLLPGGLGERMGFWGDESLGLEAALSQIANLQAMDSMEAQLDAAMSPGDLAGIDREELARLAGEDSARDLDALDRIARSLEEAGYLARDGDRLELTPRGTRRIGQKVLDDLFARLRRDAFGGHRLEREGRGGEPEETTKPYEFGDPFLLDLRATLGNAIRREENAPGRRIGSIRLEPGDFEVQRTEQVTRTSTVLLVDMSRSMLLRGCFVAAKKVAIALDTLIRTQFPRDDLMVVGFAYYAREIRPESLAELSWHGYEYGTNLQHGLMLARRHLAAQPGGNKEIVVITDGEPTAHFEDGQVEFSYPPTRRTVQETLREVVRCTRAGITINTFMLERSRALTDFVALITRLNRGRAFYADPEQLGEYVLVDFVSRRTKRAG
jgi:uncharacterized protein with von Willebrand factor type A (vWA) domain